MIEFIPGWVFILMVLWFVLVVVPLGIAWLLFRGLWSLLPEGFRSRIEVLKERWDEVWAGRFALAGKLIVIGIWVVVFVMFALGNDGL